MRKGLLCSVAAVLCIMAIVSCGTNSTGGGSTVTPAQAVAAAKAALAICYVSGDSGSSVTHNLTLLTTGADGTTISWTSSDPSVISTTGVVTQPVTQDANVTLTATISVSGVSDTKTFPVTVKAQMTEAQAVAAAKAALAVGYASGDSAASVTQNLTLAAAGIDTSTVAWSSSDASVVTNAGVVARPSIGDASVTLTATITVGSASDTKTFAVTVKAQMTDAQAVAAAKAALAVGYASDDSAASVTQNLTLSATGIDTSTIAWSSSDTSVVTNAGVVARPSVGDASVTLTATISVGSASDTKTFPITVKAQMTDAQAVAAAKAALAVGYASGDSAASVTQNLTLPATGIDTSTIAWSSSDTSVVTNAGVVTRPSVGDASVTLTATVTVGSASDTKTFPITVKAQMTDAQAVAAAKAALAVGYASGDSAASVTQNLTLATTGIDNSTIAWASSDSSVVSNAGAVTRASEGDASVTLTATITVGSASDTKTFPITVKAQMTDAEAVAAAKAALTIGYATGDSTASVTQNLRLTVNGTNSCTVSWASSDAAVAVDGTVTRPLTGDVQLTLTATITYHAASDTKVFNITVKAQMTDAEAVAAAKAALEIGYVDGDSATSVTQNVTLPATGIDNSTIAWSSDNAEAVSNGGVVSRASLQDVNVTITATITVGTASDTKAFPVTVKAQMTDADAVAAAKAALDIGYATGDAQTSVTQNMSLPTTGADSCTISWASSDPAVAADGTVMRPVTGDLPVTLTATISSHAASDTKVFIVTVKAQMTDAEAVAAAIEALQIGYAEGDSAVSVTQNVTLPLTGASACTISWASSDLSLISNDGVVQRPPIGTAHVLLTATVSSHEASDTANFSLTVTGQMSDQDAVAAAKAALQIGYAEGDSAGNVTQNVTLPSTGVDSCTVTWSSNAPELISNLGVVAQPTGDPSFVTLTATIASNAYSETRDFVLTVMPAAGDAQAVAADKAAITIGYGPGDAAAHVTGNIVLPTSGVNGSTITWASSNPAVVSISGGVTVPTDSDAAVTMTATITKGLASDTADFPMTVKAMLLSAWVDPSSISPGNGAIEVDPGIVVRIPFRVFLDPATVDDTTFQIVQTSNSQSVPIIVTYDDPSRTVSLAPQAPLAEGTQYSTVVSTALRDSEGGSLPSAMGFSFTTLSYGDILSQWKMNGNGNDASGHGNDLTDIAGSFDPVVVHEGSASLYLDGGSNAMSNVNLGAQLSVAVWVNVDNPIQDSINTLMSNADTGESTNGFKLGINRWETSDESVVIEVGDGFTGGKWTTAPGLIQPGSWYHLVFVIDEPNQVMKIYYNGVEAPLTFVSDEGWHLNEFRYDFNTAGPFWIGSFPGGFFGFKGHLDDMRVYNRVLSADEIAKIAQEK